MRWDIISGTGCDGCVSKYVKQLYAVTAKKSFINNQYQRYFS